MRKFLLRRFRTHVRRRRDEDGFTLVELMVVLVIIGLLATVVIINVMPALDRGNATKVRADITGFEEAIEIFRISNARYPTAEEGLQILAVDRRYIRRVSDDPWGRPYRYLAPGRNGQPYSIKSSATTAAPVAAGPMPTSPTDQATLLSLAGEGWRLVGGGGVAARGGPDDLVEVPAGTRTALAVPGAEVAIHWLELAGDLTQAQAAGAARLMLADASAEGLSDMHVAVGNPENGLTPVALVANASMADWVAGDPDLIVPTTLLLLPPGDGLVRREAGAVPDYRGLAAAFSVEPEIAEFLVGEAPVRAVDETEFEAGLAAALAGPVINLRQGAWARRRQWKVDTGAARRVGWLVLALAVLSLVVILAQTMRYSSAASALEDEVARTGARAPASDNRPGFTPVASVLFAAIQAVPNVELGRLDYRADGTLVAIVTGDTPATLQALRRQIETGGLQVQEGTAQPMGARATAELLLRPL